MRPLRILIVAPEYPPAVIGGGGAVYKRLAESLQQFGHAVTVCHGEFPPPIQVDPRAELESQLDQIIPLRLISPPPSMSWLISATPPTPRAAWRLRRTIASQPWDVAHLHGVGFPLIDFAGMLLRRQGVPFVLTAHGVPMSPLLRGTCARVALVNYLKLSRRTIRQAHSVTGVSHALLQHDLFSNANARVIYNGIDLIERASEEALETRESIAVCSISRLSRNKGIDVAIRAIATLRKRGLFVRYDIYGADGGDAAQLRDLVVDLGIADRVTFKGTFEPTRLRDILAAYQGLIVPSLTEAFGLAALEGLAYGVPVIASKIEGLREVMTDDCAILVQPGGIDALAHAIIEIMDSKRRARLRSAGYERAKAFSWGSVCRQYEAVLENAALRSSN